MKPDPKPTWKSRHGPWRLCAECGAWWACRFQLHSKENAPERGPQASGFPNASTDGFTPAKEIRCPTCCGHTQQVPGTRSGCRVLGGARFYATGEVLSGSPDDEEAY